MISIQQPPILRGTDTEKISRLHSYLYQIARDLNHALNNLTEENFVAESSAAKILSGGTEEQRKELDSSMSSLKSLIIKTADTVNSEIEKVEATLKSEYVAQSEFGTFTERFSSELSATASELEQNINHTAEIESEFENYTTTTKGYIRQGAVGMMEDGVTPIIGIAIGQNIKIAKNVDGTPVTVLNPKDNVVYDVIDTSDNMSIWTSEKLSFYINNTEVGYFSNGALYTGDTIVTGKLFLASAKWEISHTNGFTVKWIGGGE